MTQDIKVKSYLIKFEFPISHVPKHANMDALIQILKKEKERKGIRKDLIPLYLKYQILCEKAQKYCGEVEEIVPNQSITISFPTKSCLLNFEGQY